MLGCFNMGSFLSFTVIKSTNSENKTLKDIWIIFGVSKENIDKKPQKNSIVNVFEPNTSYENAMKEMTDWIGEGSLAENRLKI